MRLISLPWSASKRVCAWVLPAVVVVAALGSAGCNTTEGAGRDIKSVGKGIEEAASDAKD